MWNQQCLFLCSNALLLSSSFSLLEKICQILGLPSLTLNQPLAGIKTVPVCPLFRLLGAKEPGKLEPFLLFWLMPELTTLSESSFSICLKTWRLCAPQSIENSTWVFTSSHFQIFLSPFLHSRATPFLPCLLPTLWSPRTTPHTHTNQAQPDGPEFLFPRSIDTQGWFLQKRNNTLWLFRE